MTFDAKKQKSNLSRSTTLFLVFLLCVFLAIILAFSVVKRAVFHITSDKVMAVVEASTVGGSHRSGKTFYITTFRYEVDGKIYSSKIETTQEQEIMKEIKLYYNPQNPTAAELYVPHPLEPFSVLFMTGFAVVTGMAFFKERARQKKKANQLVP